MLTKHQLFFLAPHFPSLPLLHKCTVYSLLTSQEEVKRDFRAALWLFASFLLQHQLQAAPTRHGAVGAVAVLPFPASCPGPCHRTGGLSPAHYKQLWSAGAHTIYCWGAKLQCHFSTYFSLFASAMNLVFLSSQKVMKTITTVWQAYHLHGRLLFSQRWQLWNKLHIADLLTPHPWTLKGYDRLASYL